MSPLSTSSDTFPGSVAGGNSSHTPVPLRLQPLTPRQPAFRFHARDLPVARAFYRTFALRAMMRVDTWLSDAEAATLQVLHNRGPDQ